MTPELSLDRKMNKIVFINRFFYPDHSATSQILSDLAFDLASRGLSVTVAASRQRYDQADAGLPGREEIRGVSVVRLLTTHFGRARLLGRSLDYLTFYASSFFFLLGNLKPGDLVVAETDPPLISVVATAAAKMRGAKLLNWTQDVFPEVAIALDVRIVRVFSGFFRALRNWSLRGAAANVAIGERMADVIREQGAGDRVRVIHNWSDGSKIRPVSALQNALRREWGLEGKFVVGYSGNMGRAHEFDTVLSAASRLSQEKQVVFLFIGDGKRRKAIEAACIHKNINNIVFKPFQPYENLSESLSAADAHLVCLRPELEGFIVPSKFYGILAAGRPVLNIGSAAGETGRLIQTIGCGSNFDAGQGAALAETIRRWSRKPAEADEMGRRGRAYFEKNFDSPIGLKAWYDVITSCLT